MSIDSMVASTHDSAVELDRSSVPSGSPDILERLLDASIRIPGLTLVSSENMEIMEHLGAGRDLIVNGPERLVSLTCAALPAIAQNALIVVVSQSMANIQRLTCSFEQLNIRTASFDLAPTKLEKQKIWEQLDQNNVQILLIAPGRFASQRFRQRLQKRVIKLVIVDQAQLMSPWSHKFAPNYRAIGSYLSTLTCEHKPAQKIAVVWNPSGRINHDLIKVLSLNSPFQGRLTSENMPGIGIECKNVSSDTDRSSLLLQELERNGGQGVIFCNSIKHVYDTSSLLESIGEDFAVIRPGMKETLIQSIKTKFNAGHLRIVVSIGAFLSELEGAHGLEFVIFNGLPESVESMAKELLAIEERRFIKASILVGDKDYFQHRFAIDKNYPDSLILRACLQSVRDVFGSKTLVTPETLTTHVKVAVPFPPCDVEQCLQVLFREGLLEKVVDQESGLMSVGFSASPEEETNFWHEYPLRKIDHIARLEKVRDFASKDGDRFRHLQSLIRI